MALARPHPAALPVAHRAAVAAASDRSPQAAAVLVAVLVARAVSLGPAHLDELWWLCHVATATIALGLAAGWPRVVAGGWLFHLAWGAPMWLLDALATGTALPSSIAAHVGPLVVGALYLGRRRWPGPVALPAWTGLVAVMVIARPLTAPAHNVNSTYALWPPADRLFPSVAVMLLVTTGACLCLMVALDHLFLRWRGARP